MMMRRVDLLPASYALRRRERRIIGLLVFVGLILAGLMVFWWMLLGNSVSEEQDNLAAAQARNQNLQGQIAELQRFALLETEVQAKRSALQTVMAGDLNWPSILTEIAMVIPGEVWLESLNSSAGTAEGAAQVGTETAAIRISDATPAGRIQFSGRATSMPAVAEWLVQLRKVEAFTAIWLNSASSGSVGTGIETFTFDSTLELGPDALSNRYQGDLP